MVLMGNRESDRGELLLVAVRVDVCSSRSWIWEVMKRIVNQTSEMY